MNIYHQNKSCISGRTTEVERESNRMSKGATQSAGYRFDHFYLDASNRQLFRNGEMVPLNSKYFDVLLLLASQSGQLVEKQRIFDEVWSGVFVTDAALTQCIKDIRKQLGDSASNPRYIKTVPKHGYIFIGDAVELLGGASLAGFGIDRSPAVTAEVLNSKPDRDSSL